MLLHGTLWTAEENDVGAIILLSPMLLQLESPWGSYLQIEAQRVRFPCVSTMCCVPCPMNLYLMILTCIVHFLELLHAGIGAENL